MEGEGWHIDDKTGCLVIHEGYRMVEPGFDLSPGADHSVRFVKESPSPQPGKTVPDDEGGHCSG